MLQGTYKKSIYLPQIEIITYKNFTREFLLIGGGRSPSLDWLKTVAQVRPVGCIDHGLDICLQCNLQPKFIIGDGDSASATNWQKALSANIPVYSFSADKDLTDTQLALDKIANNDYFVILTGALGGRFDHAFSTIFSFASFIPHGCISDEKESIFFLRGQEKLDLIPKSNIKALSLLPLAHDAKGVSIEGVKWPLNEEVLLLEKPYAISNVLTEEKCTITLKEGLLGVYICWQEDKNL